MTMKQAHEILAGLSEDHLREVLDFARFLQARPEHEEWARFGAQQLARAYGPDESEYYVRGERGRKPPEKPPATCASLRGLTPPARQEGIFFP
jgi:hypothetical protein